MGSTAGADASIAQRAVPHNRWTRTASSLAAAALHLFAGLASRDGSAARPGLALALSAAAPDPPRRRGRPRPRTMAESLGGPGPAASAGSAFGLGGGSMASASPCPCCAFLTDEGLFLPPGSKPLDRGGAEAGAADRAETMGGEEEFVMMSPREALQVLREAGRGGRGRATLVDTHGHAHLDREGVDEYAADNDYAPASAGEEESDPSSSSSPAVVSLTCAVSENDWERALEYASASDRVLPALGVHPWYLPSLSPDYLGALERLLLRHPRSLVGEIGLCKVAKFVRDHPEEEGGKAAAMEWQRRVFREQFELAARLGRPVTVHCVRQHGVFMAVLKDIREEQQKEISEDKKRRKRRAKMAQEEEAEVDRGRGDEASNRVESEEKAEEEEPLGSLTDAFPPAIAMHSFTGTAHHVREVLKFEESLFEDPSSGDCRGNEKKKQQPPRDAPPHRRDRPPLFYFGFSHIVNVSMCSSAKSRRQGVEAVRAVPPNRLLAESDVHSAGNVAGGTAGSVAYLAAATASPAAGGKGDVAETAERTARNGLEFLNAGGRRSGGGDGPKGTG